MSEAGGDPGPCPACGSKAGGTDFRAKGLPEGGPPFGVVRCGACGLGWTVPAPSEDEIGKWYPPAYYGEENVRFHWALEVLVRLFRYRRARVIRRRVPAGRVLDVGCGRGIILGYLKSFGYEPSGVEISEHAAWHARRRMGLDVHVGDFRTAPHSPESFDVVIFWHSLEHFRRPFEALRRAGELLKKGGLLVVAVPNSESLQARLTGADWFHLDVPRHHYHFGLGSLAAELERRGFSVVQADHFSLEQNPYGWLQSFYNALGFEFDFLYSWLKNRSSRVVPILRHPFQALGIFLLLPLLLPLSLALTLLEAAVRRGGTVEVYALKR
ncbi:MAG: class I SAM-dependent methyltransferase [Elusimicrobiota bacterium]